MKKRVVALLLCGAMGLSVAACGDKKDTADTTEAVESATESTEEAFVPEGSQYDLNPADYTTLCDYSAVPVTITGDYEVNDEDVQNYYENWYAQSGPFYVADDTKTTVEEGDIVNVDYVGKLDGEAFDGGSAENQNIDVYANTSASGSGYIDGFTEGLKGASVGDVIDCDVTFPDDYSNTDLAGKAVVFTFTVNSIQKEVPIDEVDDAFVADNFADSLQVNTVDELIERIRTVLESNAEYNKNYDTYTAVQNYLIDNCTVDVPEDYLQARVDDYRYSFVDQYCGGDESKLEDTISTYYSGATLEEAEEQWNSGMDKTIRIEFIMQTIADELGITIDEDEYADYVQQALSNNGYASEEAMYQVYGYGDATYGEKIYRMYYLCDQALDKVLETAVVTVEEATEETESTEEPAEGTETVAETEAAE